MQVKRIRRNSAASIVRHELKKMIKSGYFKDGAIPSEEGIAAMFGVSRTTVRDALANLENLGYISQDPGPWNDHQSGRQQSVLPHFRGYAVYRAHRFDRTDTLGHQRAGRKRPADPEIAGKLQTQDDSLYRVTKVFLGNKKPAIYGMNYYTHEFVTDEMFQYPMDETSIFNILQEHFQLPGYCLRRRRYFPHRCHRRSRRGAGARRRHADPFL